MLLLTYIPSFDRPGVCECDNCHGDFPLDDVYAGPIGKDDGLPAFMLCAVCANEAYAQEQASWIRSGFDF